MKKQIFPAASTLLGFSSTPVDHPNDVGYLGMHGNYAYKKITESELAQTSPKIKMAEVIHGLSDKTKDEALVWPTEASTDDDCALLCSLRCKISSLPPLMVYRRI
ncbi:hypothetical protein ACFP1I_28195 [Dyadobacter subterraneus]|uniref:Uncharacterized protein n=1 Tax=Dyadobacter subterraneus TaxID=2773304 RepID=A0ABR9WCX6_9BACT|nr:hypothetical protein [Dyadobacter subterraneus]MBE9463248.1 hypothetical protein [Dyadobacter subterraneus]